MRIAIKLILAVAIVISLRASSFSQESDNVDIIGVFQGELYSNKALGFSFKAPPKWFVPSEDQLKKYVELGKAEYRTGDPRLDNKVGNDKVEFAITKKKIDSTENPILGYGLTKQGSSEITANMVATAARDYFIKVPTFKLNKDISKEKLGNREFVTFELGFDTGSKQKVRTYMTMVEQYTLTFVLTYWEDADLKLMVDSLDTIKFRNK